MLNHTRAKDCSGFMVQLFVPVVVFIELFRWFYPSVCSDALRMRDTIIDASCYERALMFKIDACGLSTVPKQRARPPRVLASFRGLDTPCG